MKQTFREMISQSSKDSITESSESKKAYDELQSIRRELTDTSSKLSRIRSLAKKANDKDKEKLAKDIEEKIDDIRQMIFDLNESMDDKKAYQMYFDKMLKKYGVESPEDLSDEDKKKFFDEVDKGWKADKESD